MAKVRVLWSGLTGRTGREAISEVGKMNDVEIIAGISRFRYDGTDFTISEMLSNADGLDEAKRHEFRNLKWYMYDEIANPLKERPKDFDVIVDFSHPDCFDQVLELAVRTHVPLISGTSGLSNRQMAMLYDATSQISVFRGGNFRFKVKKFIDEAVELAKTQNGRFILHERFYEGKSLPSETSKVIQRRFSEEAGKTIEVYSSTNLPKKDLPCDWRIDLGAELRNNLHCHTVGFSELAHDVLRIAALMPRVPRSPGHLWLLDEIWDDLKAEA